VRVVLRTASGARALACSRDSSGREVAP
jgi:hypothetical protein